MIAPEFICSQQVTFGKKRPVFVAHLLCYLINLEHSFAQDRRHYRDQYKCRDNAKRHQSGSVAEDSSKRLFVQILAMA